MAQTTTRANPTKVKSAPGNSAVSSADGARKRKLFHRLCPCFPRMPEPAPNPRSVLFVCLGNICRSPMAEAVFRHLAKEQGVLGHWKIDSAATASYHVGETPDHRAEACLKKNGVVSGHIVRQLKANDFNDYACILGMDHDNVKNIKRQAPSKYSAKIELLGQYGVNCGLDSLIIEDPYYGGPEGFDIVYEQCVENCRAFLEHVEKEISNAANSL